MKHQFFHIGSDSINENDDFVTRIHKIFFIQLDNFEPVSFFHVWISIFMSVKISRIVWIEINSVRWQYILQQICMSRRQNITSQDWFDINVIKAQNIILFDWWRKACTPLGFYWLTDLYQCLTGEDVSLEAWWTLPCFKEHTMEWSNNFFWTLR